MRFIASFKDGVIASVEGVNTCFTYSGCCIPDANDILRT